MLVAVDGNRLFKSCLVSDYTYAFIMNFKACFAVYSVELRAAETHFKSERHASYFSFVACNSTAIRIELHIPFAD